MIDDSVDRDVFRTETKCEYSQAPRHISVFTGIKNNHRWGEQEKHRACCNDDKVVGRTQEGRATTERLG